MTDRFGRGQGPACLARNSFDFLRTFSSALRSKDLVLCDDRGGLVALFVLPGHMDAMALFGPSSNSESNEERDALDIDAPPEPATQLLGNDGNNSLTGVAATEDSAGLDGDDTLDGFGGKDSLSGGDGDDDLWSVNGNEMAGFVGPVGGVLPEVGDITVSALGDGTAADIRIGNINAVAGRRAA